MFNIINLEEVTSTMDEIKKYSVNTIVVANRQTKGRGKDDRNWVSDNSNNLYMTLSLKANNDNVDYSHYTFLTSIAVIKTIVNLGVNDNNIKSKWPNDVLINSKKFCGILLERDMQKEFLSIGVGINIDSYPELLERMIFQPTSLLKEGFNVKKKDIFEGFVDIFEQYSNRLVNEGFEWLRNEWLNYAYSLGNEIIVKIKNLQINGIFEDLDKDGTLLLRKDDNIIKVKSGDIF